MNAKAEVDKSIAKTFYRQDLSSKPRLRGKEAAFRGYTFRHKKPFPQMVKGEITLMSDTLLTVVKGEHCW